MVVVSTQTISPRRLFIQRSEHRKALRVSLAIFLATALGYSIDLDGANSEYVQAACKWAAITSAIVAQPLLGSAARTGAERTIGTIFGGLMGLLLHQSVTMLQLSNASDGILKAVGCASLAAAAILIGEKRLGLNYSAKLFQITMILVTFAAESSDETEVHYFVSRVAGIAGGVLLMLTLSVILLPKSATKEALKELGDALDDLILLVDELFGTEDEHREGAEERDAEAPLLRKDRRFILLAENLAAMTQNVAVSKSERVISKRPLILLPRLWPSKVAVLPDLELREMANDVRQVAESVSFLHRAVQSDTAAAQSDGISDIVRLLRRVLIDVKGAFPERQPPDDALWELLAVVAERNASERASVYTAAKRFLAADVNDLHASTAAVVPLLPTYDVRQTNA